MRFLQYIHEAERTRKNVTANLQSKSFPVEKLSAAGFLIGSKSLAYRLDSTWKIIGGGSGRGPWGHYEENTGWASKPSIQVQQQSK